MLWTVRHCWPAGARFVFNCYRHWVQLLFHHPGDAPVIFLSRQWVAQGEPLSMVIYGITLVPLDVELRYVDPTLLSPFYVDDASFDGLARYIAAQLRLLMEGGADRRYFPDTSKSLFIANNPEEKEVKMREFDRVGLNINYVDCIQYLGA